MPPFLALNAGFAMTDECAARSYGSRVYPNVAKAGGLQSQGAKGAAVVHLLQALGNAGSGVLRLSRRVDNMA